MTGFQEFLLTGGPALWAIAALSVLTLALILWKLWDMARLGAWSRGPAEAAVASWQSGAGQGALVPLAGRSGLRSRMLRRAIEARLDPAMTDAQAREDTARIAKGALMQARRGLRALELIATIAPLIGLLGTVLGMIEAFQALQAAGNRADPAALAGGIWQALLTTAAGMAVAIPASMALSWYDSICERVQADMEDLATRVFTSGGR
ncbi:MotA/TolQ/ExbB proton channel family protein [Roseibaca sp. V10]|uniref:MotA/TolQ/ExbB proton channel family protein n=1 Tax=Roseinatronobacter domitianus TaxID=2940293 RepID=A0ABT0M1W0_9RHOB|nr:MotA/TolQ/ExbB proton channel family protein [Roseibaca domitiana]MCL1628839.1 MotA/TolQ/ExbB proton channel family protein [Roseibaca domitiana]